MNLDPAEPRLFIVRLWSDGTRDVHGDVRDLQMERTQHFDEGAELLRLLVPLAEPDHSQGENR